MRALRWAAAHVEEVAASLVVIALCLLAFANIVTRYAMSYSFACSEELEVAGLVWLTMLGAATSDSSGWHVGLAVYAGHARIVTGFPRLFTWLPQIYRLAYDGATPILFWWSGLGRAAIMTGSA